MGEMISSARWDSLAVLQGCPFLVAFALDHLQHFILLLVGGAGVVVFMAFL